MASNDSKRVFVAISLPHVLQKKLAQYQQEIKQSFPEDMGSKVAKWVKPQLLHITLLFLGEVKTEHLPQVCQVVKEVLQGWKSFDIKLSHISYGPTKKMPPRLIWLTLGKNMDLQCIANALQEKMQQAGLLSVGSAKAFTGHITLARVKEWLWKRIEPEEQPQMDREANLIFSATSVDIMESALKRSGPEYLVLQSIPFA
jgi:2'-5' RNA ligase